MQRSTWGTQQERDLKKKKRKKDTHPMPLAGGAEPGILSQGVGKRLHAAAFFTCQRATGSARE
jgi:hypothetical protein